MLPDIGFFELFIIGAIALIVVGPRELPGMLKAVGQFVGQARQMAREFRSSLAEMAEDTELDDLKKTMHDLTDIDIEDMAGTDDMFEVDDDDDGVPDVSKVEDKSGQPKHASAVGSDAAPDAVEPANSDEPDEVKIA